MPPFFLPGSRRARLVAASVLAGIMVLLCGCSDTPSTPVDVFAVTSVSVNPEIFLGDVTCGENGLRRYVATLSDVTGLSGEIGGEGEFKLPSSSPVPCFLEVRFERLVIGREYVADIQGYDRDDIVPLGCYPESKPGCAGSPVMVDAATGEYVTPHWTTSCARHRPPPQTYDAGLRYGYGECRGRAPVKGETPWLEGPVCVVDLATIPVRGCDPLKASSGTP
jgi:hypothetical protein